jgi:hypothetical protein
MVRLLKSLRRRPGEHREVFAEFAVQLVFLVAEHMAARKSNARLRVVG